MTAVTVPCSAKTVILPPSGFLKMYFSLYPLPPIPFRTMVGFPKRAMRSATLSPGATTVVSSLARDLFSIAVFRGVRGAGGDGAEDAAFPCRRCLGLFGRRRAGG